MSQAYYGRLKHPRIRTAIAVGVSWLFMTVLLFLGTFVPFIANAILPLILDASISEVSGNAYEFMYRPMSYTASIPVPLVVTTLFMLRVLTARFGVSAAISETPVLQVLPLLILYSLMLPALAANYLQLVDPVFPDAVAKCVGLSPEGSDESRHAIAVGEQALRLGVMWRNAIVVSALVTLGVFYLAYSTLDVYPRRAQTLLLAIMSPMVALGLVGFQLAHFVSSEYCTVLEPRSIAAIGAVLITPAWDFKAWLMSWVATVPIILVGTPFLIVTLSDPLKGNLNSDGSAMERLELERSRLEHDKKVRPTLPIEERWGRSERERRVAEHDDFTDRRWRLVRAAALFWLRTTRAQAFASAIWRNNLTALVFTLPVSLLAGIRPLLDPTMLETAGVLNAAARSSADFYVVAIGLIGGSLVWLGVLITGLYFFETTAERAFEAGLLDAVRRQNEHTIVVGYDDLGRRLVAMWVRRNLLGYGGPHDHFLRGPNIVLPDGRVGRLIANATVIDEPLASGIGLINVGPGVKASVVSLSDVIRPMHAEILAGKRQDLTLFVYDEGDLKSPSGDTINDRLTRLAKRYWLPLLAVASKKLSDWTREYDFVLTQLVEYYVPLVAGDASAASVRDVARFSRASFVVSALQTKNTDGGFATVEAMESLRLRGFERPLTLRISSSALTPQIVSRTMIDDVPMHAVSVDRLEASEPIVSVSAAILKRMRSGETARVLIAARGKRLFHLLDGLVAMLEPTERRAFGTFRLKLKHVLVVVSDDPVVAELPTEKPAGLWTDDLEKLERAGLKCRFLKYLPYVTRHYPQGSGPGEIARRVTEGLWVLHVSADSRDHQTMAFLEKHLTPNIIMISDQAMIAGLRSFNALGIAMSRQKSTPAVQVFVAADRGRFHLTRYYWNALWYAAGVASNPDKPAQMFPRISDGYIDPLRDAVERITGIWSAYSKTFRGRPDSSVVELHACSTNRPGSIADTLVRLCGAKSDHTDPGHVGIRDDQGASLGVSLLDTRLEMGRDGKFTLRALCRLHEGPRIDYPVDWSGCRLAIHAIYARRRRSVAAGILHVLKQDPFKGSEVVAESSCARQSCCGMLSCPIEANHKVIAAAPVSENSQQRRDAIHDKLADRYWSARNDATIWKELQAVDSDKLAKRPLAIIKIRCHGASERGTFAVATSALLGWRLTGLENRQQVVQLTYLSGSECHDNRFGLFSMYGFTQSDENRAIMPIEDVVRSIDVRPICHEHDWARYLTGLERFMNRSKSTGPYNIHPRDGAWRELKHKDADFD